MSTVNRRATRHAISGSMIPLLWRISFGQLCKRPGLRSPAIRCQTSISASRLLLLILRVLSEVPLNHRGDDDCRQAPGRAKAKWVTAGRLNAVAALRPYNHKA